MRVLHVNSGNLFGGVETLLLTLARHPGPAEPHFALCFEGPLADRLGELGAPVHRLGGVRVRRPWTVWRARRALRRVLAAGAFDVAVCHSAWSQAVFGSAVRRAGVPLAFWLHGAPEGRLHWLERAAARTPPDVTVCNSHYTLGLLPRLYPAGRGEVVYCPAAPPPAAEPRAAVRARLGVAAETAVVIQVGRWDPIKGHPRLLEALARLRGVPGWECWQVAGAQRPHEAAYEREVRGLADRLGIADRVRFLGWQRDVGSLLAAADVYCQANERPEPFGLAFVEALYAGLPVVTTALGGPCEIVDDSCGRLVPPGDAGALAGVLRTLVEDAELRTRLGAAGPARARDLCDPDLQARRLADVLAGIAGRVPASAGAVRG